ncbi:hypothetical protein M409DRAFT_24909 [Zasmidium cellare ATCC 36951]|uniref:Zn(2)-C6 fungal-type domain-containing protein n=1 Tax=Zasmidium cellare ATCC 36951 TaxID=1080233 RepID=A0A6A6CFS2_ZASCE|nr:uncharacterized protein M409DRAFT_24909 [Zasmidium cellare ATCC 36951]KAF2165008.1 hypothetical protein M409DRAFT_24909 [Zasmidium cellare ATCC 36951]
MADRPKPKINKSRSGCSACKKKRMKCDETLPQCRNCVRRKLQCPGYERQLKWSTKYERLRTSRSSKESQANTKPVFEKTLDEAAAVLDPKARDSEWTSLQKIVPSKGQDPERRMETASVLPPEPDLDQVTSCEGQIEVQLPILEEDRRRLKTHNHTILESIEQVDAYADVSPNDASTVERVEVPKMDPAYLQYIWEYVSDNDDHADKLVAHYFDVICQVMSCFDSASNPYRTAIPQSLSVSPHIFDCLMTMSAAHMANYLNEYTVATLRYQTKAMSSLQEEMASLALTELATATSSKSRYQLLLGTIILGMTSAWHDPTAYSLSHLKGARSLFQAWSAEQNLITQDGTPTILNREQSFLVGSMAYWECLASILIDQSLQKLDYLKPFSELADGQPIYPNSWTGVSTPTFIFLAQVGVLLRQKRVLEKLVQIDRGCPLATGNNSGILADARQIHDQVLNYNLPSIDSMEETGDPNTPLSHLCDVAKVYRFVILLELYQAFPTLLESNADPTPAEPRARETIFDLATSALTILSNIPRTSGVFTVLSLAYISAGSAVQLAMAGSKADTTVPGRLDLDAELNEVRHSKTAVQWWRDNLRQQIIHSHKRLGIASLGRGAKLVQEVWNRSDLQAEMAIGPDSAPHVHWLDVMIELRLETLYG